MADGAYNEVFNWTIRNTVGDEALGKRLRDAESEADQEKRQEEKLAVLEELEYLCENLDNAHIMHAVGAMEPLVQQLRSEDVAVQAAAQKTLGMAVQNFPHAQSIALSMGALPMLAENIESSLHGMRAGETAADDGNAHMALQTGVLALSSLVRDHDEGQDLLLQFRRDRPAAAARETEEGSAGGASVLALLVDVIREPATSLRVRSKALLFVRHLFSGPRHWEVVQKLVQEAGGAATLLEGVRGVVRSAHDAVTGDAEQVEAALLNSSENAVAIAETWTKLAADASASGAERSSEQEAMVATVGAWEPALAETSRAILALGEAVGTLGGEARAMWEDVGQCVAEFQRAREAWQKVTPATA